MYELKWIEKKAPDGTSYNDFPKGWRSISQKEFVQGHFFRYNPALIESRQMYDRSKENWQFQKYCGATLYWFHDNTGVAMETDHWKGEINYYAFGCDHDYQSLSQEACRARKIYHAGRCYHVSECSKCGNILSVDSSD